MPPAKVGRPSTVSLSPAKADAALADVRHGLPIVSALVLQGIAKGTVDYFLNRNPTLRAELAKAEAEFERGLLENLVAKSASDARVAQWLLERRAGGQWAPVTRAEVTGKDGGPLQSLTISRALLATIGKAPDAEPVNVTPRAPIDSKSNALPRKAAP